MVDGQEDLRSTLQIVGSLGIAGLLVGIGQLMRSKEKITLKVAIGRAIMQALLAVPAASIYLVIPEAPLAAVIGVGAALSSLGVSGLEKLLEKLTERFFGR